MGSFILQNLSISLRVIYSFSEKSLKYQSQDTKTFIKPDIKRFSIFKVGRSRHRDPSLLFNRLFFLNTVEKTLKNIDSRIPIGIKLRGRANMLLSFSGD